MSDSDSVGDDRELAQMGNGTRSPAWRALFRTMVHYLRNKRGISVRLERSAFCVKHVSALGGDAVLTPIHGGGSWARSVYRLALRHGNLRLHAGVSAKADRVRCGLVCN